MQTAKSNLQNLRKDDIHNLMDASINESNLKTELNMFTFGSENIRVAEEEEDDLYFESLKYLYLGMRDQTDCDITFYTYAAIDFIEEALRSTNNSAKVLVHCYKGNSRSAAVVAGYLMWKNKIDS
jgi:protein-tyrosine phosphatase